MDSWKLVGIVALAALSGLLWLAFIRRAPEESAPATIVSKTFQAASTYTQQPVGANRGFRTPTTIPIPESYLFELKLDDRADPLRASINVVKSRQLEVGQRVRVQFKRRGIPPFWQRVTVVDVMPLEVR